MNLSNSFSKLKDTIWNHYTQHPGKMLMVTGLLGWILSSAAQVTGIVLNSTIDKKKKFFLIPQEILDGAVNATLFWAITSSIMTFSDTLVEKGKVMLPGIKSILEKNKLNIAELSKNKDFMLSNVLKKLTDDTAFKSFGKSKKGLGVIASISGSVIACNIVTPLVRNYLGGIYQKHAIENESPKTQIFAAPLNSNTQNIDAKTFPSFAYNKNTAMKV